MTRRLPALLLAAALPLGLAVAAAPAATADVPPVPAPLDFHVAFDHWQAGQDVLHLNWDAPQDAVSGYVVGWGLHQDVGSGSFYGTQVLPAADATSADLVVPGTADGVVQLLAYRTNADGPNTVSPLAEVHLASVPHVGDLVGSPVNGEVGTVHLRLPVTLQAGDVLHLRKEVAGHPLDGTPDGGVEVPFPMDEAHAFGTETDDAVTGQEGYYELFEVAPGGADQWSFVGRYNVLAAPAPFRNLRTDIFGALGQVQLTWDLPTSCPADQALAHHCNSPVIVLAEGTSVPTPVVADQLVRQTPYQQYAYGSFSGLQAGHTYTVAAYNTAGTEPTGGAYSAPVWKTFTYTVQPVSHFVGSTSTRTVTDGARVSVTGALARWADHAPVAGEPLQLRRQTGSTSVLVAAATTNTFGEATLSFVPHVNGRYFLTNVPDAKYFTGSSDQTLTVDVRPVISLSEDHRTVHRHHAVTLTGTVHPLQRRALTLQVHTSKGWTSVRSVAVDAHGHYRTTVTSSSTGTRSYRVERVGDATLATGVSRTVAVTTVR